MPEPEPIEALAATSTSVDDDPFEDINCLDERHIATALYLLHKVIALRELPDNMGWPEIHACLRDAASHCEAARQHWTKEALQRRQEILRTIFGDEAV